MRKDAALGRGITAGDGCADTGGAAAAGERAAAEAGAAGAARDDVAPVAPDHGGGEAAGRAPGVASPAERVDKRLVRDAGRGLRAGVLRGSGLVREDWRRVLGGAGRPSLLASRYSSRVGFGLWIHSAKCCSLPPISSKKRCARLDWCALCSCCIRRSTRASTCWANDAVPSVG